MKIVRSIFATAAAGLLLAVCGNSPLMARGGEGYGDAYAGGIGGHEGWGGDLGGGLTEGLGGTAPLLDQGTRGNFGHDNDGYTPQMGLPLDSSDYDNAEGYKDYFCGRTYPSYNIYTETYINPEGKFQHCP